MFEASSFKCTFEHVFSMKKELANMSSEETVIQSTGGNITDAVKKVLVINCAVNIPLAITSIIGNSLVLHAVWKTSTLRSPSVVLLCGLALSDFAVGAVVQPFFIAKDLIGLLSQDQSRKTLFLRIYNVLAFYVCGISLFTITAISLDRLVAIQKPLRYPSIVTIPRVICLLVVVWTTCAILVNAQFWNDMIYLVLVAVVICVCLFISAFSHVKIYKIVRDHKSRIQIQREAVEANTVNVNNMLGLKTSAFNALIVFLVLILCYCPYFIVFVVTSVYPINVMLGRSLASTIVFINSSLNPFLYCWRIYEIREVVKQTCHKLVQCCK